MSNRGTYPNRAAICPDCGKQISSYVPTSHSDRLDGPRCYVFRMHNRVGNFTCPGWASRVPDDAFVDKRPNIDSPAATQ